MLTPEEEARLWQALRQAHAADAREKLIRAYLPMSAALAMKYAGRGLETEDLKQISAMALVEAVDRYEPERGISFATFSAPTIAGILRHELRDRAALIRTPERVQHLLAELKRVTYTLEQRLCRSPRAHEVAAEMAVSEEEVLSLMLFAKQGSPVSLDAPVEGEEELTFADLLGGEDPGLAAADTRRQVEELLARVTEPERALTRLRYFDNLSQRETARKMGLSQVQVSRMERRMLHRLREEMEVKQHDQNQAK